MAKPQASTHDVLPNDQVNETESGREGVLARFRRTASSVKDQGLNYFAPQPSSQPTSAQPSAPSVANELGAGGNIGERGTRTPTAFERFIGKTRKEWNVVFPPPHWSIEDGSGGQEEDEIAQSPLPPVESEKDKVVQDQDIREQTRSPPDPDTLARRIQALLSTTSLPFFAPGHTDVKSEEGSQPAPPVNESVASGTDTSAPPTAVTSDPELISLLSSPDVMNGKKSGVSQDGNAEKGHSVWDALERLTAQVPWMPSSTGRVEGHNIDNKKGKGIELESMERKEDGDENGTEDLLEDDESGVMVYGPLFPSSDPAAASEVELAKSEFITVPAADSLSHGTDGQPTAATSSPSATQPDKMDVLRGKLEEMWPFSKKPVESKSAGGHSTELSNSRVHFQPVKSDRTKRRVWVPSRDQISVQVMWWGYRIYLPPPILAQLDNSQLETAKRAALLTTALKYVLDRIPLALVPLQARPALRLFKAFTPYLAYVGGFVAWSWGAVKGFDKGSGVTLSATWLLTLAVVPGTWEKDDFPEHSTDSSDVKDHDDGKEGREPGEDTSSRPPPLPPRPT